MLFRKRQDPTRMSIINFVFTIEMAPYKIKIPVNFPMYKSKERIPQASYQNLGRMLDQVIPSVAITKTPFTGALIDINCDHEKQMIDTYGLTRVSSKGSRGFRVPLAIVTGEPEHKWLKSEGFIVIRERPVISDLIDKEYPLWRVPDIIKG